MRRMTFLSLLAAALLVPGAASAQDKQRPAGEAPQSGAAGPQSGVAQVPSVPSKCEGAKPPECPIGCMPDEALKQCVPEPAAAKTAPAPKPF